MVALSVFVSANEPPVIRAFLIVPSSSPQTWWAYIQQSKSLLCTLETTFCPVLTCECTARVRFSYDPSHRFGYLRSGLASYGLALRGEHPDPARYPNRPRLSKPPATSPHVTSISASALHTCLQHPPRQNYPRAHALILLPPFTASALLCFLVSRRLIKKLLCHDGMTMVGILSRT